MTIKGEVAQVLRGSNTGFAAMERNKKVQAGDKDLNGNGKISIFEKAKFAILKEASKEDFRDKTIDKPIHKMEPQLG